MLNKKFRTLMVLGYMNDIKKINKYKDNAEIPQKKCFEIYSKYSNEINYIKEYGLNYHTASLLKKVLKKKDFIDKNSIKDIDDIFRTSLTFSPSCKGINFIYTEPYILFFRVEVYYQCTCINFIINSKDDKMQQLKNRVISLFNEKYHYNINKEKDYNYFDVMIFNSNFGVEYIMDINHINEKRLLTEIDVILAELYDKIITVRQAMLEIYGPLEE